MRPPEIGWAGRIASAEPVGTGLNSTSLRIETQQVEALAVCATALFLCIWQRGRQHQVDLPKPRRPFASESRFKFKSTALPNQPFSHISWHLKVELDEDTWRWKERQMPILLLVQTDFPPQRLISSTKQWTNDLGKIDSILHNEQSIYGKATPLIERAFISNLKKYKFLS